MVRCFLLDAALYNLSVIVASLDATSPSRGGLGIPLRFRAYALRYFLFCCRQFFFLAADAGFGAAGDYSEK
jgi:hypothetical protein